MPLRPSLEQVMWENGAAYFCILVSLNVADMILTILSITIQPGAEAYIAGFIDPISSILNSRFLLHLHETNARLEGADASMTSYSLRIDSGGDPRTGSPELPPFLGIIGGPIHSFPPDDQASLDFAPQSREEPIPDPEAALGSSGAGEQPA
ncbi:uncharacterized protein TRAVEDRAFT_49637 [Trametes versicolor FP-101664 SS1]|uniref:uncharacterized protein n=1 Tax=Trametes versicolor (strain FP-101664) TaxID=717944 RepID=UPI000462271B|nr:uncharacterized protein TRAVEDRAFT_49637 [Trametes versicolor FP-101664 SS1]EIW56815.1 hypothetical protein TRAVEDRAFT_49637 [Trametes versicolor FP-101664 SS1]